MKNRVLSFTLIACIFAGLATAQSVSNGSFETWVTTGSYEEPTGWKTSNELTNNSQLSNPQSLVTKDTVAFDGNFSVRLETNTLTVLFQSFNVPGVLTNGEIDQNAILLAALTGNITGLDPSTLITGGSPISSRPAHLTGRYQFAGAGTDSFLVVVSLTKFIAGSKEMVATGFFRSNQSASTWTGFAVPLEYTSCEVPDTALIVFLSSSSFNASPGSVLWVDSLNYFGTATNTAPTAGNVSGTTDQDVSIDLNILANSSDCDPGQTLTYTIPTTSQENATLTDKGAGVVGYDPAPGFFGDDRFFFTVCDNGTPSLCSNGRADVTVIEYISTGRGVDNTVVTVFPNPATDVININSNRPIQGVVKVFNILGNEMLRKDISNQAQNQLDISDLKNGFYFYMLEDFNQNLISRGSFKVAR